jgi:CRISPR/Cas system-associated protein Csx1
VILFSLAFTLVSRFLAIFVAVALLLPSLALAKRVAPEKVEPVTYQGVRYIAPNDDGRRAYIEARDVQTNKKLWELTIFTNRIDPTLEEDVQWVFIKALNIRNGALVVTSERDKIYRVDLKTKAVTQGGDHGQS